MLSEMIALEFDDGCAYAQTSAKKQQHGDVLRRKKRTEKSKNAKIEEKKHKMETVLVVCL